jgi:pyruvate,water dikinase
VQAGVVFTSDPGGPEDHVRVEAVDGLGEALVSGAVTPRSWSLPRGGATAAPVPIREVVDLALAAEQRFGIPLDVEWAWDGQRAWLVQARPITTADGMADDLDTPADDHALTTAGIAEMLPGVLPPLVWQLAGTAVEEGFRASFDALGALDPDLVAPHALVRRVRGRTALDLDALTAVAARLPGGSAEAVEHGFFGAGDPPPAGPRAALLPSLRHALRVDGARRHALHEARVTAAAAEHLASDGSLVAGLSDAALLGLRRRLVDLGQRAMTAEIGVSAAAAAAYERLHAFVGAHLSRAEATRWAQRVTVGISGTGAPEGASMSVFAGPTWQEAGLQPPAPPPADSRGAEALAELEGVLRTLPRWQMTRIVTGQVVDVRLHLLRRLTTEATSLLRWRERAKVTVLTLGGLVRAVHLALAARMVARGELAQAGDVDLLTDAELRGDDRLPPLATIGRRRRALARMTAAGSLPERFSGRPEIAPPPLPSGDRLTGVAASAGRHTARARVVRDPLDATLRAGEVLVAETTDAGWSPLFARAGAIVVERGGQLSHAAIVARELGVPAVLDVDGATGGLDGRTVTVDGDRGVVVIHDEGLR